MEIMLIDDDRETLKELVRLIEPAGHRCRAFLSTAAAQAEYSTAFDVAITEWKRQQLDALAFLDFLREQKATTKVVILTGYGNVDGALAAAQRGVYAFFNKPARRDELLATLEEIGKEAAVRRREAMEYQHRRQKYQRLQKAHQEVLHLLEKTGAASGNNGIR